MKIKCKIYVSNVVVKNKLQILCDFLNFCIFIVQLSNIISESSSSEEEEEEGRKYALRDRRPKPAPKTSM